MSWDGSVGVKTESIVPDNIIDTRKKDFVAKTYKAIEPYSNWSFEVDVFVLQWTMMQTWTSHTERSGGTWFVTKQPILKSITRDFFWWILEHVYGFKLIATNKLSIETTLVNKRSIESITRLLHEIACNIQAIHPISCVHSAKEQIEANIFAIYQAGSTANIMQLGSVASLTHLFGSLLWTRFSTWIQMAQETDGIWPQKVS